MSTQTQAIRPAGSLLPVMHRILARLGVEPEPPAPAVIPDDDLAGQLEDSIAERIAATGRAAQLQLFGAPAIIPVCAHCHQPRSKVIRDRAELARRYPDFAGTPAETEMICCSPDSECRCPRCNSELLEFAMHYASASFADGDETAEMAHCQECGWAGEAEEAAPPAQPWTELAQVTKAAETRMYVIEAKMIAIPLPDLPVRVPATEEDETERARRYGKGDYREVAA